ncbi:glycoside hydrolase family 55 protein [Brucella anthropi]|uniref:glycoside hydrolase family 55 protein n=1 Tax=Brucella anthropi TaxID=529 RepID=UPI002165011F|nr:glycoside hydrolase family 55 protein [Brucella anthropi]UVV68802.1 glycoside hydrolase family 55 protein [Brucella anthropi]
MFGAKGDGITDDWQAITNAIEYCRQTYIPPSSRPFYPQRWTMRFPDGENGTYLVSQPVVHVAGCTILMGAGATLKASAVMEAVVTSEEVNYLSGHHFGRFEGGIIDADNKAVRCINPKIFGFYTIENTMMLDPTLHHVDLGDADLTGYGIYEAMLKGLLLRRSLDRPPPVNSCGINISKCGDSHFEDIIIMDVERGMNGPLWDSKITRVHVWNTDRKNHPVKVGFFNTGGQCIYSQCQVDGPLATGGSGWYFSQPGNVLLGCSVNGEVAGSNVFQGVFLDMGAFSTVIGCTFKASSGMLSGDILGPGVDGSVLLGNISVNCTVVQGNRLPVVGTQSYTAAQLAALTNKKRGDRAFCHDASASTFASVLSGGGSNWVPVVFNGNNWIVG